MGRATEGARWAGQQEGSWTGLHDAARQIYRGAN